MDILLEGDNTLVPPYACLTLYLSRLVEALGCSGSALAETGGRASERAMRSSVPECRGLCSGGVAGKPLGSQSRETRVLSIPRVGVPGGRVPVS